MLVKFMPTASCIGSTGSDGSAVMSVWVRREATRLLSSKGWRVQRSDSSIWPSEIEVA